MVVDSYLSGMIQRVSEKKSKAQMQCVLPTDYNIYGWFLMIMYLVYFLVHIL